MNIADYHQKLAWMNHLHQKLQEQEDHLETLRGVRSKAFDAYKRSEIAFEAINKHREKMKYEHQDLQLIHDANQADEDWRIRRSDSYQIDANEDTGALHA